MSGKIPKSLIHLNHLLKSSATRSRGNTKIDILTVKIARDELASNKYKNTATQFENQGNKAKAEELRDRSDFLQNLANQRKEKLMKTLHQYKNYPMPETDKNNVYNNTPKVKADLLVKRAKENLAKVIKEKELLLINSDPKLESDIKTPKLGHFTSSNILKYLRSKSTTSSGEKKINILAAKIARDEKAIDNHNNSAIFSKNNNNQSDFKKYKKRADFLEKLVAQRKEKLGAELTKYKKKHPELALDTSTIIEKAKIQFVDKLAKNEIPKDEAESKKGR